MKSKSSGKVRSFSNINNYMIYIIFVVIFFLFTIFLGSSFFSASNLLNVLRQTAMISIMAVAMTFVISSGEIDLSIGAIVALTAIIVAKIINATGSIMLGVLVGLAFGAVVGIVNGFLTTFVQIPSFLVTMGIQQVIRGFAMMATDTKPIPIHNNTFNFWFGQGAIPRASETLRTGGVPVLVIWTIVIVAVGYFAFNKMPYGKKIVAAGGNKLAAQYTGINVRWIKTSALMWSGMAASLAGMLYAGRMGAAQYSFGTSSELTVIAAVIIGGTSMNGGIGNIFGALVGSLLMGILDNALVIGGFSVSEQMIFRGAIIVIAVALYSLTSKKRD